MDTDEKRRAQSKGMDRSTKLTYAQLHKIEEELIQVSGLIKALQKIQTDDGAATCVTLAISEKVEQLQHHFYLHWESFARK